jgi:hypothetical protein
MKIKELKIYIIISSILLTLLKVLKMGRDKEKLNQYKKNEKLNKKVDNICNRKFNVNKLRKLFHRKGK